ncbi:MAG: hypothetical protein DRG35_03660 [Deltaproteobacteria bacterium]|nr:MAG: hypothetical protein DRG35_03660 [Deltaproteobacteria bacterium]RLB23610.1 MAG: hypothetical protein DRG73_05100 [Deltaproteobacteria bacterium]
MIIFALLIKQPGLCSYPRQNRRALNSTHIVKTSVILEVTGFFFINISFQNLGYNIIAVGIKTAIGYGNAKTVINAPFMIGIYIRAK